MEPDATTWRCACGGLYTLPLGIDPPASLARVSMGEGRTPLVHLDIGGRDVVAKLELDNPTHSFKDRGVAFLIAAAVDLGASDVVADSSGNAAISIAAYAQHAGLGCEVFVPASMSLAKVGRLSEAGARVSAVKGTREDVAAAAMARVESTGAFYASHVWNPWFYEGTKQFTVEVHEQLGGRFPDALVLPAGNGTLVLGAWRAMQELSAVVPLVVVQAETCAPLARAFRAGDDHVIPVANEGTAAVGIAIAAPPRGDEILAAVRASGGSVITVNEDAIAAAAVVLARHGFDVEPTAAVPAAALAHVDAGEIVIPLSAGARR